MDYELMMNGNVKIGQKAPKFEATTTFGTIKLEDYQGKWLVLFSHPGDFTPVCTTEMIAFTRAHNFFRQINCELLGLSVDSNSSHEVGIKLPKNNRTSNHLQKLVIYKNYKIC